MCLGTSALNIDTDWQRFSSCCGGLGFINLFNCLIDISFHDLIGTRRASPRDCWWVEDIGLSNVQNKGMDIFWRVLWRRLARYSVHCIIFSEIYVGEAKNILPIKTAKSLQVRRNWVTVTSVSKFPNKQWWISNLKERDNENQATYLTTVIAKVSNTREPNDPPSVPTKTPFLKQLFSNWFSLNISVNRSKKKEVTSHGETEKWSKIK